MGPADYINYFENPNRREKKGPAAPAKTYDEDDMPTALLPLNDTVESNIFISKVKPTVSPKKLVKKSLKVTSDMPTVVLAQDYENFFTNKKKGPKTVPKKKATSIQDDLSDCPTALLAPKDYQNLFANYRQKNTRTPPQSEVPASIVEMIKPRKTVETSVVNEPKIVRSVRPKTKTVVSPSTSTSQGYTSPTSKRRVSPPPLPENYIPLPPERYFGEDCAEPEKMMPMKTKKKKKRKKCCCCCW